MSRDADSGGARWNEWNRPLPAPLAVLEQLLNGVLSLDAEHAAILAQVEGARVRLVVDRPLLLRLDLWAAQGRIRLGEAGDDEADVELCGSAWSMLALLRGGGSAIPGAEGVTLRGDLAVLEAMKRVIGSLQPDWEEPVARVLGDRAARPVTQGLTELAKFATATLHELREMSGEYLREESTLLVRARDFRAFGEQVQRIADDTERLLKRYEALERRLVDRA